MNWEHICIFCRKDEFTLKCRDGESTLEWRTMVWPWEQLNLYTQQSAWTSSHDHYQKNKIGDSMQPKLITQLFPSPKTSH